MEWQKEQLDAIETVGENLLVSAAAGSGKTAVLTERVARLVELSEQGDEKGANLDEMLIITFTNAATAEMKSRIMERAGVSPFTKCSIYTFDKFAIDVYKNYYHIIGLPPGLRICDNYKQQILSDHAMDELFEELFAAGDKGFKMMLDHYCEPKNSNPLRKMIGDLYTFTRSMPYPKDWLCEMSLKAFDSQKVFETVIANITLEIEIAVEKLKDIYKPVYARNDDGSYKLPELSKKLQSDVDGLESILNLLKSGDNDKAMALFAEFKFQDNRAVKGDDKDYHKLINDELKRRDDVKKTLSGLARIGDKKEVISAEFFEKERVAMLPYVAELCRLTDLFAKKFAKKKLAAGLMDFSDAEHFALEILSVPEVRSEYREKFKYIFVDEYQDSNYVQEELIKAVSRGNNVFMVGDIKQSIYKFRLAEPEIFLKKAERFRSGNEENSRVIDLNRNFRSKPGVIECVNNVFERVMTGRRVGFSYDETHKMIAADYDGPWNYDPKLFIINTKAEEDEDQSPAADPVEELKNDELEAINAVKIIKEYHGKTVNIKGVERPLKYSDMALLFRSVKNRGETFYRTLLANGIPAYIDSGEGYFDTVEVTVLLNLLKVIDNPRQDVPLLAVMHFPSLDLGFNAEELALIRINGGVSHRASYYEALAAFVKKDFEGGLGKLSEKAGKFMEKLASWRFKSSCVPLSDFIWELMHESGIAGFAQALSGGNQRIANLRAMADRAGQYELENASGLSGFVRYIELIGKDSKVETGQVKLLTEQDDVVRIMTIHKSKGLEFPFVMLAGLGSRMVYSQDTSEMRRHRDLGIALKITDPSRGLVHEPSSFKIISNTIESEMYAENVRILYVAMTRARDVLVMSAISKDAEKLMKAPKDAGEIKAKSFLEMVKDSDVFRSAKVVQKAELDAGRPGHELGFEIRQGIRCGFNVKDEDLPEGLKLSDIRSGLEFTPAPEPSALLKRKYTVSELAELSRIISKAEASGVKYVSDDGAGEALYAFGGSYGREKRRKSMLSAAETGTAYHAVMEHIPFGGDAKDPAYVEGFIETLREKHILSDAEAKAVDPERIAAFFASELGKRACESAELHKETPFIMKDEFEGREVLVQGVIDCYFREGDSFVLVDYKSNYVGKGDSAVEKLREHYLPQLILYRRALEEITGVKVKETSLYLFGIDQKVTL